MRNDTQRLAFASFLNRLACAQEEPSDWYALVITHYSDEELEEVRRELVRLATKREPNGNPVWDPADRQRFREWAISLGGSRTSN